MTDEERAGATIEALREELDRIDDDLVDALARRFHVVARVGTVKAHHGAAPWEPGREAAIVRRAAAAARGAGVPEEGVREVFWAVLGWCRQVVSSGGRSVPGAGS